MGSADPGTHSGRPKNEGSDDPEAPDWVDVKEDAEESDDYTKLYTSDEEDEEDAEEDAEETLKEMAKPRPRSKPEKEPLSQRQIERWAAEAQALKDEAITW